MVSASGDHTSGDPDDSYISFHSRVWFNKAYSSVKLYVNYDDLMSFLVVWWLCCLTIRRHVCKFVLIFFCCNEILSGTLWQHQWIRNSMIHIGSLSTTFYYLFQKKVSRQYPPLFWDHFNNNRIVPKCSYHISTLGMSDDIEKLIVQFQVPLGTDHFLTTFRTEWLFCHGQLMILDFDSILP